MTGTKVSAIAASRAHATLGGPLDRSSNITLSMDGKDLPSAHNPNPSAEKNGFDRNSPPGKN